MLQCVLSAVGGKGVIKRKLGFSKRAMGAQAEALVPSTVWCTVF